MAEAGRLQEDEQARGVDRVVRVPFMELVQPLAREAVGPDQHPAGSQDAVCLAQDPELLLRGGTWWSIVKQPTESNDASENGECVASPT